MRRPSPALLALAPLLLATAAGAQTLQAGLTFRIWDIQLPLAQLPTLVAGQLPNVDELRSVIDFPFQGGFGGFADRFYAEARGHLGITTPGAYDFRLTSDDGSSLAIDGQTVILHDGQHSILNPMEGGATLTAGTHPFVVRYFDDGGWEQLRLEWRPPGASAFTIVPASAFRTESGAARPTAPGRKYVVCEPRPGLGLPLPGVHPGHDLIAIRPPGFEPKVGGLDFLPDGRLVVCVWGPVFDGELWLMSGVTGPSPQPTVKKIASRILEPLGVCTVGTDIYVCQRNEISQFIDRDGDDLIDERRTIAKDWLSTSVHEYTFGLAHDAGFLYATLSANKQLAPPSMPGPPSPAPSSPNRGTVVKVDLATQQVSYIAGGLRTPNGIGFGPGNGLFVSDNQGNWLPASKLLHIRPGRFYGHFNDPGGIAGPFDAQPETLAAVLLPQEEISRSPSEPVLVPAGTYAGQMLMGDVTAGGIQRIFLEQVQGEWQGAVFRFTMGLEVGINRLVWGPDGALYAGGLGLPGDFWNWNNTYFGLQKLMPNATLAFEIKAVRAVPGGFELEFTKPVAPIAPPWTTRFRVKEWTYTATIAYGGPKEQEQELTVTSATLSADARRITLLTPGLQPSRVVHIVADVESATGEPMWSPEAWYTLNRLP